MAAPATPLRRRPRIADPERFKRHAIAALCAWLDGHTENLQGHLDHALEAVTEPPRSQQPARRVIGHR